MALLPGRNPDKVRRLKDKNELLCTRAMHEASEEFGFQCCDVTPSWLECVTTIVEVDQNKAMLLPGFACLTLSLRAV